MTEAPLEAQMEWIHGSKMSQTYVHLSMRDQDRAILKVYGIEVKKERNIETEQSVECPRCEEPNDKVNKFYWKCGMILDKTLTEKKLMEEAKEIETSLLKSHVVDNSTKKIIKEFPPEFKEPILETVLKQIVESPDLRESFRREIAKTKRMIILGICSGNKLKGSDNGNAEVERYKVTAESTSQYAGC
ncbi:MAG: hypothetical protein QXZ17_11055 [Nitrososphaerota archaeon]